MYQHQYIHTSYIAWDTAVRESRVAEQTETSISEFLSGQVKDRQQCNNNGM